MFFNLSLEYLSNRLVSRREEMVSQHHFFQVVDVRVVIYGRVQIKQHRQVNLLLRIKQLVLKAKALYFVEVQ